jgi:hypothetical protein
LVDDDDDEEEYSDDDDDEEEGEEEDDDDAADDDMLEILFEGFLGTKKSLAGGGVLVCVFFLFPVLVVLFPIITGTK